MTIRAKLYAAIVLTILGPLATTAVALHGMGQMGDRFDEVQERARHESIALELKFGVTDVNGWQTAYGYDDGARGRCSSARRRLPRDLRARPRRSPTRASASCCASCARVREFMALDGVAYRALRAGDEQRGRGHLPGPGDRALQRDGGDRRRAGRYERPRGGDREAFDDARDDARKRLIAVALGAGIVIVLLLVTASDVARMALEGERHARPLG